MSDDPQKFLAVALEAVKKAEPVFLDSFGCATGIEVKPDAKRSQVTAADKAVEKLLVEEISGRFQDHGIVGEEGASRTGAHYTWFIDPIDGTTNYIRGIAQCSISVALWDAKGPLVGIVSDPVSKVVFSAVRDGGAFRNGEPIKVCLTSTLGQAVGNLGWDWADKASRRTLLEQIEKSAYRWRVFSNSALEICLVAAGQLDFFVNLSINIWDMAAGVLVLTEAGGKATEKQGGDITPRSKTIIASNTRLHSELLGILQ